jgi:predicted metal-dependent hydrolase
MWVLRRLIRRRKAHARSKRARASYAEHKERARAIVHERVAHWAPQIGVTPGRIAIRDQSTRWGSCSTKGNLNFNYRVVHIPVELVDYVVVHELCHLIEFNHSERFWSHVRTHLPSYELHKKALHIVTRELSTGGSTAMVGG